MNTAIKRDIGLQLDMVRAASDPVLAAIPMEIAFKYYQMTFNTGPLEEVLENPRSRMSFFRNWMEMVMDLSVAYDENVYNSAKEIAIR